MSMKRAIIYVGEVDEEKIRKVKESVSNVLATYSNSVLVEVDENQIDSLKDQGLKFEVQEKAHMIRLQTVEFDTSEKPPSPPSILRLSDAEIKEHERNYWIVQFIGPVKPEWGEKIRNLGGKLHNYIPENAFLVNMSLEAKEKVEKLSFVNWVGLYEPAYKVSPQLMGRKKKAAPNELVTLSLSTEAFKPAPEGNMNVIVHDPADMEKVSQEIEKIGGKVVVTGKDVIRASLDPLEVGKLAKMVEVKWLEPYALPKLFNDVAAKIMEVQPVWDNHGLDGEGQIVAVADTGLDTGDDVSMHEDFKGRIVNLHSRGIPKELRPYLNNKRWDDGPADAGSGHGTHVAGSVLGNGAKSGGSIRGMAYKARLVVQAVEQWVDWKQWIEISYDRKDGHYLLGVPEDLNDLFQQAYDDGARIHTNSWGDSQYGQYAANSKQIDEFVWNHKDMVILFAAGNDGKDGNYDGAIENDSLSSQSSAKNCISVGASESKRKTGGNQKTYGACWPNNFPARPIKKDYISDDPEGMAAFSGRGPTDDGRIKPDVVAPGTNILSVRSSKATGHGWGLLPASDPRRPYYMYMGGTSMATPLTAGVVALIRQYLQKVRHHENPSAALIKAVLIHGASPMAGQYNPPEVGPVPDYNQGWGRVNLKDSVFPDPPVKMEFEDDPADFLGTGEQKEFTFKVVSDTVPFKVTLVWTDYPSDPETGGGLVNTLRLSVEPPSGNIIYGVPANNNVQQVRIDDLKPGEYTVRVEGVNIGTQITTGAKQDFALVISGGLEE